MLSKEEIARYEYIIQTLREIRKELSEMLEGKNG